VKYALYATLFAIFLLSFFIRGIIPINNVFSNGVTGFAIDDSVMHMRLVENTINFFPHRIFFDAFTQYPYGTKLHWGPLFDQMIAFFAILMGIFIDKGIPSQSVIETVGAFYPAVLGSLVVFPVYIIGKEFADEKAGLIAAFLTAILPGQFLERSVLGFTDNHVAEVFYLTIMVMFFVMAIKKANNIPFENWIKMDLVSIKTPLAYSLLAGFFFGSYLLVWTDGVFFAVVFAIFLVVQYIIDHFRSKPTEYLGIVGTVAYFVAMIMILPYFDITNGFNPYYYSFLHIAVTGGGAVLFIFLTYVSREMNKRDFTGYHYTVFVIATMLILLVIVKLLFPELYSATVGTWNFIFLPHTGGSLTIAEAMPFMRDFMDYYVANQPGILFGLMYFGFPVGDQAGSILGFVLGNFGYNYYLAYIAIAVLCYYVIKKPKAELTLIAVWSIFVLAILLAQNRFAYYYSINVAILSGFLCSKILDKLGWQGLALRTNDINIWQVACLVIIIAFVGFWPPDSSPFTNTLQSAKWGAETPGEGFFEWHDALAWMRNNTPDPGLPYFAIYQKPKNVTYPYPDTAYGVMSWWDYGNIITYWAHRIPNANPFQEGIGGGPTHLPGASTFLLSQTEEEANGVLDKLGINGKPGARYVVSNAYMAYSILTVFAQWDLQNVGDYFTPVQTSQGNIYVPSTEYLGTMEAKLHIFDGNNLKYYRMIHESKPNPDTNGGIREVGVYTDRSGKLAPSCDGDTCTGKYWINQIYKTNISLEYTGYAKIFEYVKGAKVTGTAPTNANVTISNTIITNTGRKIQYSQQTTALNGTYSFTVPYSTRGPIPGETQFDTKPEGPYTLESGNISKKIDVGERDVLDGNTLRMNLI
jgi:oligosaccharyl transferase (archaeosortase A-associated)